MKRSETLPKTMGSEHEIALSRGSAMWPGTEPESLKDVACWELLHTDLEAYTDIKIGTRRWSKSVGGSAYTDAGYHLEVTNPEAETLAETLAVQAATRAVLVEQLGLAAVKHKQFLLLNWRSNDGKGNDWGVHTSYGYPGVLPTIKETGWLNTLSSYGNLVVGGGTFVYDDKRRTTGCWVTRQKDQVIFQSAGSTITNSVFSEKGAEGRRRIEARFHAHNLSPWAEAMQLGLTALAIALDFNDVPIDWSDADGDLAFLNQFANQSEKLLGDEDWYHEQGYAAIVAELRKFTHDYAESGRMYSSIADRAQWAAKRMYHDLLMEKRDADPVRAIALAGYADLQYTAYIAMPDGRVAPGYGWKLLANDRMRAIPGLTPEPSAIVHAKNNAPTGVASLRAEYQDRVPYYFSGKIDYDKLHLKYIGEISIDDAHVIRHHFPEEFNVLARRKKVFAADLKKAERTVLRAIDAIYQTPAPEDDRSKAHEVLATLKKHLSETQT